MEQLTLVSIDRYHPMRSTRRASSSAISTNSVTDLDETHSDHESFRDINSSPSSRPVSPGNTPLVAPKKSRTAGLRLSLKSLRSPKSSSSQLDPQEMYPSRTPVEAGPRTRVDRRLSVDQQSIEGRTSFEGLDPRSRDVLSTSAPKTPSRFSFIHSPAPSSPSTIRPSYPRHSTTPTHSPSPSNFGTSPRRTAASPSPQPVRETNTMLKEYDPLTGNKMINKYMIVRELGRGVHGKVKLCRDTTTNELCAIKIMDKTTRRRLGRSQISNEQKIRREIAIMKKCIHPHVVQLIEVIDDPNARKIYLVLEYMEGGEVRWKDVEDKPILPLPNARMIFRDIVLGLEYLHMQGIIHRDIKPANLLLNVDGSVKISDFGVSHFSEKNSLEHDLQSPIVENGFHVASPGSHAPLASPLTPSFPTRDHSEPHSPMYQHRLSSTLTQQQQWGDDLELAKTAGSPAFFAPELCYASEYPALSPAIASASQTSFIISPPTPRTNPSTPLGSLSIKASTPGPRPPITKSIDIWALGVTLYCFVYGRCPFVAETEFELFNIIPRKEPSLVDSVPGRRHVDQSLKDLLSRLLEKDVAKRITLKEVKEHPWVTEDLEDPERWRIETDPANYQQVHVTEEEVKSAVKIMDKIKNRIRKLSVSISNFTGRRRSKSISSTYTPNSPTGSFNPIPITRSPAPTSHGAAPPSGYSHTLIAPGSLPERFQHFHSYHEYGSNHGRFERPNSIHSNTSSIDEGDEGDDLSGQSGSGSSAQNNTSYVGRRRVLQSASQHPPHHGGHYNRPPSIGSYPTAIPTSVTARRTYSDDQLDQHHGQFSARMASNGHSGLSKSWVYSSSETVAPSLHMTHRLSHRTSTLSPSSTLASDVLHEHLESLDQHSK